MRYTAMPNAEEGQGIWAACGVNEAHIGMTATETITSNPRVLGADPLVRYQPAKDGKEEIKTGLKKFGAMLGDYVEVGCNSVLNPGTVIGAHTNVYPLSMVRGVVADHSIYKNRNEVVQKNE